MAHSIAHDNHHDSDSMDVFGFWLYILSDCILFGTLFTAFASLKNNLYGGLSLKQLTDTSYILIETMVLLASSFTYGMAILSLYKNQVKRVMLMLAVTFMLGVIFVGMEVNEFVNLYAEGHGWQSSAGMSAFFTLVGTHGLHVMMGLIWMAVMIAQLGYFGITPFMRRRLSYLGLFWAFLDIVWIFVFTIVYLMGAI
jgi:cytochrome o ubiquinol oxidase subunit III